MSEVAIHAGEPVRSPHQHEGAPAQAHGHDSHEHSHGHHGPAHLHHHFTDTAQQRESNALGMWVFLVTEVMTFGALFFVYTLYRNMFEVQAHQQGFLSPWGVGSHLLNNNLGFINTLVLLCSSLTVATAVHAAGMKNKKLLLTMLGVTWVLGAAFLGIKSVEWTADYHEGIVPGINWNPTETLAHKGFLASNVDGVNGGGYVPTDSTPQAQWKAIYDRAAASGHGGGHGGGHETKFQGIVNTMHLQMFFVIYFCMTGLHAIHMVIGLGLLVVYIRHARNNVFTASANDQPVEIFGLYWHFVDIVWIFLYPLLYLVTLPVTH
ncbi:MAG TPA: cytochrome c oxidase subunit 3 [Abditibacterium sp.]